MSVINTHSDRNSVFCVISTTLSACVLFAFSGCERQQVQGTKEQTATPATEAVSPAEIPMCEINVVESCEAESSTATETIYHCPSCAKGVQCPDCQDHDCKSCAGEECRCRVKHGVPDGAGVTGFEPTK